MCFRHHRIPVFSFTVSHTPKALNTGWSVLPCSTSSPSHLSSLCYGSLVTPELSEYEVVDTRNLAYAGENYFYSVFCSALSFSFVLVTGPTSGLWTVRMLICSPQAACCSPWESFFQYLKSRHSMFFFTVLLNHLSRLHVHTFFHCYGITCIYSYTGIQHHSLWSTSHLHITTRAEKVFRGNWVTCAFPMHKSVIPSSIVQSNSLSRSQSTTGEKWCMARESMTGYIYKPKCQCKKAEEPRPVL